MTEAQITPEAVKQLAEGIGEGILPTGASPAVRGALEAFYNGQAEKALEFVAGVTIPFGKEEAEQTLIENLAGLDHVLIQRITTNADMIREYLDNPQGKIPDELINMATSFLSKIPAYRDLILDQQGQYDPAKAKEIASFLLRNPQVREKIRELYVGRLDPAKRLTNESKVNELKQDIERIKAELNWDLEQLIEQRQKEVREKKLELEINIVNNMMSMRD